MLQLAPVEVCVRKTKKKKKKKSLLNRIMKDRANANTFCASTSEFVQMCVQRILRVASCVLAWKTEAV